MKDLVVLVADKNMEFSIRGLLARGHSLGVADVSSDVYVHPERDPGCLLKSQEFLRSFCGNYKHALVMFDLEGCGRVDQTREEIETEVEGHLSRSGWENRAAAIVIDPELENWVWSGSPYVETVLGWKGRKPTIRDWLLSRVFFARHTRKPCRPKEAVEAALRIACKPRSSSIYLQLAKFVSLKQCSDPAFLKFKATLASWFPRGNTGG